LSDLAAELGRLRAPALKREEEARAKSNELTSLADSLERQLAPLKEALRRAIGNTGTVFGFSKNDGNVSVVLPPEDVVVEDPPRWGDFRTVCVYVHVRPPGAVTLYTGFTLQMLTSGSVLVRAGHVVRDLDGASRLLWKFSRVVWPSSAEQESAFRELAAGMNANLRDAVDAVVQLVRNYVAGERS
jgi:hypothetical protein